jgi:hypothetical protein
MELLEIFEWENGEIIIELLAISGWKCSQGITKQDADNCKILLSSKRHFAKWENGEIITELLEISEWENGEIITELLEIFEWEYGETIIELIAISGWMCLQGITKHERKFLLMVFRDKHGLICIAPKKRIQQMIRSYKYMFGSELKPKTTVSYLHERGEHPETDTSDFLEPDGAQQQDQSLIGAMRWALIYSVTWILHLANKMIIDWYFKKKPATIATAMYGSQFCSTRTFMKQIVDLCTTLRYLGVGIREESYIFGYKETIVESSIRPYAKLHKRRTALSFHGARKVPRKINPAVVLKEHWGYQQIWKPLQPLLF